MSVQSTPRYRQLKELIIGKISSGELQPRDRVPSENELVDATGVSRMTANRALRELNDEGYVERVAGIGTFVADFKAVSHVLEVRNIADEVQRRGHVHSASVLQQNRMRADSKVAAALNIEVGAAVFHLELIHHESGIAIQIEDRFVLAEFAPQVLEQDFTVVTPSAYLSSISPLQEAEHVVRAQMPSAIISKHLEMSTHEPCLVVTRRTWAHGRPVSFANLYHPGGRFELSGHYVHQERRRRQCAILAERIRMTDNKARTIKAPTGTKLTAKSWLTEAPLRMIMNNLDPEVAERPEDLVVYGGIGKAARNWECFDAIVAKLRELESDETLLVQSGKPVGVFKTHENAPRVLIANSNLVPAWANWEHFRELDRKGLMMFGQMTAGSWIYIGSQGIVQGTYETFVEMGRQHFGGDLAGKWILTAGLGGMGGAQPLAATMAGASMLAVECQADRIEKRLETGYIDKRADTLDEALEIIDAAVASKEPVSVGLLGNAVDVLPELLKRGVRPDAVTDQTSAHDPANGYLPGGWTVAEWHEKRKSDPDAVAAAAKDSMVVHVQAMLEFHKAGVPTFDYGNNIRQEAFNKGVKNAFDFPGFVPAYVRPLFCRGVGPFRWVALSGDPEDIYKTDQKVKELIPDDAHLHNWLDAARERIQFQGLPSRICWVGLGQRDRLGLAFNEMVRNGELKAPVVIGRDHLDSGSVASPNRETEAMLDGSDAVSDWPLLNALLNTASGATWVSFHHGGGVGMGYAQHAGLVIVCDGSVEADARIARVLWNDPATGVMRHADAGYQDAIDCARENNLDLPMIDGIDSSESDA